ncbi:hypothetical protein EV279_1767 [Microbacterium sp. BK668]|nr:hypothetical protein EV279_1767 [Microbacterium sp. BK668]
MGDELRALRERAYGPDADIDRDPAAAERLRQLESEASALRPPADHDVAPTVRDGPAGAPRIAASSGIVSPDERDAAATSDADPHDTVADPGAAPDPGAARDLGAAGDPAGDPATTSADGARPRRPILVRAIALGLAVVIGAFAAYAVMELRPGSVATLGEAPDAEWPDFLGQRQDGSEVYEEFLGLTVAVVPRPWGRENDVPCLFVLQAEGSEAITTVGCGAGGFPPTAALRIADSFPDELRAEYPTGTALQFVLADNRVVVYADRP